MPRRKREREERERGRERGTKGGSLSVRFFGVRIVWPKAVQAVSCRGHIVKRSAEKKKKTSAFFLCVGGGRNCNSSIYRNNVVMETLSYV